MRRRKCVSPQRAEVPDGDLSRQVLAGNEQAFEILVYRYRTLVSHCVSSYLGSGDQIWDVCQQVWLKLYRSLPKLRTEEPLGPWLLRVSQRCCLDELRKKNRRQVAVFSELERKDDEEEPRPVALIPDPQPLPEEIAEYHDLQDALNKAMRALPPRSRAIVFLRSYGQCSFAEIGQMLHIPAATAKTYFYRARPWLAAELRAERQFSPGARV